MQPHERIAAVLTVRDWEEGKFVVMGTRRGVIKKTALTAFSNPRAGGIIAMGIEEDDAVIAASISDGSGHVLIATRNGMAIRFEEADVRTTGRGTYGVRGIELRDDDVVVAMEVLRAGAAVLTLTENGYGKRTAIDEYRVTGRGGLGIINIQTTGRNGRVVGVACVTETDEVMFITQQGMVLRTPARNVSIIGRNTQGVRLIDMDEGDRAVSVARLEEQETEGGAGGSGRRPGEPQSGRRRLRFGEQRPDRQRVDQGVLPRRLVWAGVSERVLHCLLSAMTLAAATACSVIPEEKIVRDFFRASRLRDNAALGAFATTIFDPNRDGQVTEFKVLNVSAEHSSPLAPQEVRQRLRRGERVAEGVREGEVRVPAGNLDAIDRIEKLEASNAPVPKKDATVQATWSKWRDDEAEAPQGGVGRARDPGQDEGPRRAEPLEAQRADARCGALRGRHHREGHHRRCQGQAAGRADGPARTWWSPRRAPS